MTQALVVIKMIGTCWPAGTYNRHQVNGRDKNADAK